MRRRAGVFSDGLPTPWLSLIVAPDFPRFSNNFSDGFYILPTLWPSDGRRERAPPQMQVLGRDGNLACPPPPLVPTCPALNGEGIWSGCVSMGRIWVWVLLSTDVPNNDPIDLSRERE
ncbi:hypothetical protein PIB30_064670 [Stylosanthes scabra]|uniref:Uncharacterized protein n=1 Tax=Stylosanthes scabra TaxID=79078 RepID=A0ABU6TLK0_9FABA|nr:hypothetical protein [Stylosanthes scabra]